MHTLPLPIIYRDDHLLAIDKPAGLLVHRSKIDFHERDNVVARLKTETGCHVYPVHRLDKPTSGVLLFALVKSSAHAIATQFENHLVSKTYIAVARGYTQSSGTIDHPVRDRDSADKPRKPAETRYCRISQIELPYPVDRYATARYSLLELQPRTGRRHQLRLHMKHINHPLIGDSSYGKGTHNRFFARHFDCTRLLLHASALRIEHPTTGQALTLYADQYDSQFKRVLDSFGGTESYFQRSGGS